MQDGRLAWQSCSGKGWIVSRSSGSGLKLTKNSGKTFQSHSWRFPLYDWKRMKVPDSLRILSDKCRQKHLSYATEKSYAG